MADARELPGRAAPAVLALIAAASLAFGASCGGDQSSVESVPAVTETVTVPPAVTVGPSASRLTDHEVAGLMWMREEEQLAHDVYVELGDLWGLRIFENIAASETSHIEAVSGLLDRYGIAETCPRSSPCT
jgi:hypothetical protein